MHIWTLAPLVTLHLKTDATETLEILDGKDLPARPNSTDKLNRANLIALELIQKDFEFIHLHSGDPNFVNDFYANISEGDFVQLHIGPNIHSDFLINFLIENLQRLRDLRVRLVIGTEVTWRRKVFDGIFDQAKLVELMKFAYAILGHTPKTHTYLYALDTESEMNFVEFPLGLLEATPSLTTTAVTESSKRRLGVVTPQPGRLAKGEVLHEQVLEMMARDDLKQQWEVIVLEPPYTPQEFTDFASTSDLMVNTSLGETFSYQIQEARALGTPVLHPTSTFITRLGEDFIECWPEFGLDFASLEELSSALLDFYANPDVLALESARQERLARDYFSLEQLAKDFRKLYSQVPPTACQVLVACGHRIDEAQKTQLLCCESVHTIVLGSCSSDADIGDVAVGLQQRFDSGHASDFDQQKNLIYRRATHVHNSDGVWSTVTGDPVWGTTLDRVKVVARAVPENPGLFERMLLRLAGATSIANFSC